MFDDAKKSFRTVIASLESGETLPGPELSKDPVWHPDGRSLLYSDSRGGTDNIWSLPLAGGQPRQLTNFNSDLIFSWAISPDDKRLAISHGSSRQDVIQISDFR